MTKDKKPQKPPTGYTVGRVWSVAEQIFERVFLLIGAPGVRSEESDERDAARYKKVEKSARETERKSAISMNALTGEIIKVANDYKPGPRPKAKKWDPEIIERDSRPWIPPARRGKRPTYFNDGEVHKPIEPGLVLVQHQGMWAKMTSDNMAALDPDQPLQNTSRALIEMARSWEKGECPRTWNTLRVLLDDVETNEIVND